MTTTLDGMTGGVLDAEVDGKPAKIDTRNDQQRMIEASTEDLVHDLATKQREIRAAKSEAGKARKKVQDIERLRDGIIAELERRDAEAHGDTPLPFEPGDEFDDEGPEAEIEL